MSTGVFSFFFVFKVITSAGRRRPRDQVNGGGPALAGEDRRVRLTERKAGAPKWRWRFRGSIETWLQSVDGY